ncbi:MAG: hypothetical protein AAF945_14750, partial [Actinomycetota bacterium]
MSDQYGQQGGPGSPGGGVERYASSGAAPPAMVHDALAAEREARERRRRQGIIGLSIGAAIVLIAGIVAVVIAG